MWGKGHQVKSFLGQQIGPASMNETFSMSVILFSVVVVLLHHWCWQHRCVLRGSSKSINSWMCLFITHSSESSVSLLQRKLYSLVLCFTLFQSTASAWALWKQLAGWKDLDTSHDPKGLSRSDPPNICTPLPPSAMRSSINPFWNLLVVCREENVLDCSTYACYSPAARSRCWFPQILTCV